MGRTFSSRSRGPRSPAAPRQAASPKASPSPGRADHARSLFDAAKTTTSSSRDPKPALTSANAGNAASSNFAGTSSWLTASYGQHTFASFEEETKSTSDPSSAVAKGACNDNSTRATTSIAPSSFGAGASGSCIGSADEDVELLDALSSPPTQTSSLDTSQVSTDSVADEIDFNVCIRGDSAAKQKRTARKSSSSSKPSGKWRSLFSASDVGRRRRRETEAPAPAVDSRSSSQTAEPTEGDAFSFTDDEVSDSEQRAAARFEPSASSRVSTANRSQLKETIAAVRPNSTTAKRHRSASMVSAAQGNLHTNPTARRALAFEDNRADASKRVDLQYLLDGLAASDSITVQRTCAYNLAKLTCNSTQSGIFMRAHGLFEKLTDGFRNLQDEAVSLNMALAILGLCQDRHNLEYMKGGILNGLKDIVRMYHNPEVRLIAKLENHEKLVAKGQTLFSSCLLTRKHPTMFLRSPPDEVHAGPVATACIVRIIEQLVDVRQSLRNDGPFLNLVNQLLMSSVTWMEQHSAKGENQTSASEFAQMWWHMRSCLRLLEVITCLDSTVLAQSLANYSELITCTSSVVRVVCRCIAGNEDGAAALWGRVADLHAIGDLNTPSALDTAMTALRLLVNVSNKNIDTVRELLGSSPLVADVLDAINALRKRSMVASSNNVFDLVTLGLGLLTNCAEACPLIMYEQLRTRPESIAAVCGAFHTHYRYGNPDGNGTANATTSPASENASLIEHRVISSYAAALIGCICPNSNRGGPDSDVVLQVMQDFQPKMCAPYSTMAKVVEEFTAFQAKSRMLTNDTKSSLQKVVENLSAAAVKSGEPVVEISPDDTATASTTTAERSNAQPSARRMNAGGGGNSFDDSIEIDG